MLGRTASLLGAAATSGKRRPCRTLAVQAACAATSSAATLARYGPLGLAAMGLVAPAPVLGTAGQPAGQSAWQSAWPLLEWVDALAIIGYFSVSVLAHGATARATGLRIRCGHAVPVPVQ